MNFINRNNLVVGSLMLACSFLLRSTAFSQAGAAEPTCNPSAASWPDEDAAAEATLLESINHRREQAGVSPLLMDESLLQAARLHARRMVANRRLEHQFVGEPSLLQRIADVSSLPRPRRRKYRPSDLRQGRLRSLDALSPSPQEPARFPIQSSRHQRPLEPRSSLCSPGFRALHAVVLGEPYRRTGRSVH